jgi:hypothetical protein
MPQKNIIEGRYEKDWFLYSTGFFTAASATTVSSTIAIAADTDFEAKYFTIQVRQANVLVLNHGGLINMQFTAIGKTLSNIFVPVDAILGTGQRPYYLTPPKILPANGNIVVQFTNNVATSTDLCLTFHGNKLYLAVTRQS